MIEHIGQRTLHLTGRPYLIAHAAAVGKKEGEGPLGAYFDFVTEDDRMKQKSWELAESALQKTAINLALNKAGLQKGDLDVILAGDLLNQCTGSFLASVDSDTPYHQPARNLSMSARGIIGTVERKKSWSSPLTSLWQKPVLPEIFRSERAFLVGQGEYQN